MGISGLRVFVNILKKSEKSESLSAYLYIVRFFASPDFSDSLPLVGVHCGARWKKDGKGNH